MTTVLTEIRDQVGILTLNRPRAINALTREMIDILYATLQDWASNDRVSQVRLVGAGERGLCSGADVRTLREQVLAGGSGEATSFFHHEYELNRLIAHYPKPYQARMTGITMGGGLGLSTHGRQRIVDASSRLAMPETIIGFYPDVGVLWQLSQAPGELGTYLALTGATATAAVAVRAGLADPGSGYPDDPVADFIGHCFVGADPVAIAAPSARHHAPAAQQALAAIRARSPLSVCVTLAALRRAQQMRSVDEVLDQDRAIAPAIIRRPDFTEGVRAQLVDKDRRPHWSYARIEDVPAAEVEAVLAGS